MSLYLSGSDFEPFTFIDWKYFSYLQLQIVMEGATLSRATDL